MGGTAACIDIQAVRLIINHIGGCSQGVEHAFGNHPGASVGTVQADPHVLVGTGCQGNKVTRIAVPACRMVHGTPNLFPDCKRDFT